MSFADLERWKVTPIQGAPYLSVVAPVNHPTLLPGLTKIASHVASLNFPWEMIAVVIDPQKNPDLVKALNGLHFVNLRQIENPHPGKRGSAVRAGLLAAEGGFILLDDPDHATPIQELNKFLPPVSGGDCDIAAGVRMSGGKPRSLSDKLKRSSSGGLYQTIRWVFRLRVNDPLSGFKLYNRLAAQALHSAQTMNGNGWEMEVFYLANKWGYRVKEIPVGWAKHSRQAEPYTQALGYAGDLFKLWWNDVSGKYKK